MNGKGDRNRTSDWDSYRDNYDEIEWGGDMLDRWRESIEWGVFSIGEWDKTGCQCDPSVGAVPCHYCAEHGAIMTGRKLLAEVERLRGELKDVWQRVDDVLYNPSLKLVDADTGDRVKGDDLYLWDGPVMSDHVPALREWFVEVAKREPWLGQA